MKRGQRPEVNAVIDLKDIIFPKPGKYQFVVLIDKDYKGEYSIDVLQSDIIRGKNGGGHKI
jgi:hypothetical protein